MIQVEPSVGLNKEETGTDLGGTDHSGRYVGLIKRKRNQSRSRRPVRERAATVQARDGGVQATGHRDGNE